MAVIQVQSSESNTKEDENITENKWQVELASTNEITETEVVKTEEIEIDEVLPAEKPEIYSGILVNLESVKFIVNFVFRQDNWTVLPHFKLQIYLCKV